AVAVATDRDKHHRDRRSVSDHRYDELVAVGRSQTAHEQRCAECELAADGAWVRIHTSAEPTHRAVEVHVARKVRENVAGLLRPPRALGCARQLESLGAPCGAGALTPALYPWSLNAPPLVRQLL